MSEDRHSNVLLPFGGTKAVLGMYHGPVSQAKLYQAALSSVMRGLGAQKFLCSYQLCPFVQKKLHTLCSPPQSWIREEL